MNKICIVRNNIIPCDIDGIRILENRICFLENGNYVIEYNECDQVRLDICIEKGKCVNLFEFSYDNDIDICNRYTVERNSSLIVSKFFYNKNCNEEVNIYLNGERACAKYNFSSISRGKDKYKMNIYHNFNNTSSDIFNRTVAKVDSSNYFDINSYVENNIFDTYLNQHTKIITLGDSNNRINPNMYTHDNSCMAMHASTIGSVSEDELFYLMSRGISYRDSINLIVKGNILSNINIPDEYYKIVNDIIERQEGE